VAAVGLLILGIAIDATPGADDLLDMRGGAGAGDGEQALFRLGGWRRG